MKKKLFDLQLFATTSVDLKSDNTTTYAGYKDLEDETYEVLDRTIAEAIYEEYTFEKKYSDTITVDQNSGQDFAIEKFTKYDANVNDLQEGVVPPEDAPMGKVQFKFTLSDFGGYATFTDKVDIYSKNGKGTLARIQKHQGLSVGEKFQYKVRDVMYSSPNRWFAGVSSVSATLAATRADVTPLVIDDFRKIRTKLKRMKVKPFDNGFYYVLVSPEVEQTMYDITKTAEGNKYSFLEMQGFKQDIVDMKDGSFGSFLGFKFISEDALGEIKDISGNAITGANGNNIHGCVILGKYNGERGLKTVKLAGKGKMQTIIKPTTAGGASENPLNQIGSVGWKKYGWSSFILYAEAVMVYECESDIDVATEFEDKDRANYSGGVTGMRDSNGDSVTVAAGSNKTIKNGTISTIFTDDTNVDGKSDS